MSARYIQVSNPSRGETAPFASHGNIPDDWTPRDMLHRFGIGDHLRVELFTPTPQGVRCEVIQPGRSR